MMFENGAIVAENTPEDLRSLFDDAREGYHVNHAPKLIRMIVNVVQGEGQRGFCPRRSGQSW
jgi:hypothetical protein